MRENRKERNIAVFEDTMAWIRQNGTLRDAVEVTAFRSFEAAMREKGRNREKRVAVINFASANNTGGGVPKGSSAQEESICCLSTLYPCLNTPELKKAYYDFHRPVSYTHLAVTIPGAGLGVVGAAIGTAVSYCVGGIFMIVVYWRNRILSPKGYPLHFHRSLAAKCLRLGAPVALELSLIHI